MRWSKLDDDLIILIRSRGSVIVFVFFGFFFFNQAWKNFVWLQSSCNANMVSILLLSADPSSDLVFLNLWSPLASNPADCTTSVLRKLQ